MDRDQPGERGHESVDHDDPSSAGLLVPPEAVAPGTGIFGDETLVRDADGGHGAGIYPAGPSGTGGAARPGPTQEKRPSDLRRA
jgi:hypothetical protein